MNYKLTTYFQNDTILVGDLDMGILLDELIQYETENKVLVTNSDDLL